jgi:hypothetical protein
MAKPFYEPGRYWGRITHQKLGETKTGKPQLVLSFLVVGKLNPVDPDGDLLPVPQQYERSIFRVITENTIDYVMEDLEALEFTGGSFQHFDEESPDCCDLRGKERAFSCKHDEDQNGQPREQWGLAKDGGGPQVKPLDNKAARQLDAMFGKRLKKAAGNGAKARTEAAAPQSPPPAAASGPSDDIPF